MASLKVNRTYGRGNSSTYRPKLGSMAEDLKSAATSPNSSSDGDSQSTPPSNFSSSSSSSATKKDKASSLFDDLFSDGVGAGESKTPLSTKNRPVKNVVKIEKITEKSENGPRKVPPPPYEASRPAKLTKTVVEPLKFYDEPVTKLQCRKDEKDMYTVVKHVKQAHQCHESGETQQLSDDIEYYLSNLLSGQKSNVKYLSMCTLAQKCISANFRAHIRAYGYAKKLFNALSDSYEDPILSLCSACVFYLLSRDRLSLSIDVDTLNLALKFIDSDDRFSNLISTDEYLKYKRKIWQILCDWHKLVQNNAGFGHKILFDVTEKNLSVSFLATEALVYIFLRNKEEPLKLALCRLGGLDLIVRNLENQSILLPVEILNVDDINSDNLKLIERYLRILEQATQMCPQNQAYLIAFSDSILLKLLLKIFNFSQLTISSSIVKDKVSPSTIDDTCLPLWKILVNFLSACLKVLCNLTHLNVICCKKLGEMDDFLLQLIYFVTSFIPEHIPPDERFDLTTLALGLLINLIEPCNSNRRILLAPRTNEKIPCGSPIEALTQVFLRHEAAALAIDEDVDKKIEMCCSQEQNNVGSQEELVQQIQETLEAAVTQAGHHMEDCFIASHIALFFGLLLQQNESAADEIKRCMENRPFDSMIAMLKKFMDFLRLINNLTSSNEKTMATAIELLEQLG